MNAGEWYLWTPLWPHERVDLNCCRASVPDGGRSVTFHQCPRKPTEAIEGYGFCRQHAKKIRAKMQWLADHV